VFSQKRNDALVTIESCCTNVVTQKGRAPAAAALDAAASALSAAPAAAVVAVAAASTVAAPVGAVLVAAASAAVAAPAAAALAAAASAAPASAAEAEKEEVVGTEGGGGGGGCGDAEFPSQAKVDLVLASITCKYTQSNSVCFAKDGQVSHYMHVILKKQSYILFL